MYTNRLVRLVAIGLALTFSPSGGVWAQNQPIGIPASEADRELQKKIQDTVEENHGDQWHFTSETYLPNSQVQMTFDSTMGVRRRVLEASVSYMQSSQDAVDRIAALISAVNDGSGTPINDIGEQAYGWERPASASIVFRRGAIVVSVSRFEPGTVYTENTFYADVSNIARDIDLALRH